MISIVFDLDGTLADTSKDMLKAANLCFEEMGHSKVLSEEKHRGTALHGGRAMLTKGLSILNEPDEANIIYNFSLAPLIINTLIKGNSAVFRRWSMSMPPAKDILLKNMLLSVWRKA